MNDLWKRELGCKKRGLKEIDHGGSTVTVTVL